MTLKVFSVRDQKAEAFNQPFYAHTPGEAERLFSRNVNDPQSMINHYPDDYDLYYVGEFETKTGKFTPVDTPQHVVKAIQFKKH